MVFSSIEELTAYVESRQSRAMKDVSEDLKRIVDESVSGNVDGWTGQIFDSVISGSSNDSAEAEFIDNGRWYSEVTGNEVGNPIKFLEAGTTWNKDKTNIMKDSFNKAESEIPDNYKKYMNGLGVPLK